MTKNIKKFDAFAALRFKAFRYFIQSKFFLTMSLQIQSVIVGWQIYDLTKDPLSLGMIGLAEVIPNVSVALYAGHLADIFNRKKIVLFCLSILIVLNLLLAGFSLNSPIWFLYFIIALSGFARGFLNPANFGLMSETVPESIYINSSTWNSSLWQVAAMLGAGISGFLFNLVGYSKSYFIAAIILLVAIYSIFKIDYEHKPKESKREPVLDSILNGLRYVFSNQEIIGAMSLDMFAVLFGGAVAILPIFANEILLVGPKGLGILRAAPSLGALIMAIFLAKYPPSKKSGKILLYSVIIFGLCMIGFALSRNFYLSFFFLFLSGAVDNISVVIRSTIMQAFTPREMKGRVSSVNQIFISSSNELGAFESGVAAKMMGAVPSVIFGGVMTLIVVIFAYLFTPKLRNLDLEK